MTEAVIVASARTPIGRANKGSLVDVDAFELARVAVGAAIERSGIPVEHHHAGPATVEVAGRGLTQPGGAPGDECNVACNVHGFS